MSAQNPNTLGYFMQDLRHAAFQEELRGCWASAVLFRVPAICLAWLCARLGLAPLFVTALALLDALLLPVMALWLPITIAPIAVCLGGVLFQILDGTDGTLARRTGQTSQFGADADFLTDMAQWALLYASIGILADRGFDTGWAWTALALAAAWARLMARVIRDRLDDGTEFKAAPIRPADVPAMFIGGLSGLIPFLALSGSWLQASVIALLVYSLIDIIDGLMPMLRRR